VDPSARRNQPEECAREGSTELAQGGGEKRSVPLRPPHGGRQPGGVTDPTATPKSAKARVKRPFRFTRAAAWSLITRIKSRIAQIMRLGSTERGDAGALQVGVQA